MTSRGSSGTIPASSAKTSSNTRAKLSTSTRSLRPSLHGGEQGGRKDRRSDLAALQGGTAQYLPEFVPRKTTNVGVHLTLRQRASVLRLLPYCFFDARVGEQPHDGDHNVAGAGDPRLHERQGNCRSIDHDRQRALPVISNRCRQR